jgi:predicted nucleotidyltransferase
VGSGWSNPYPILAFDCWLPNSDLLLNPFFRRGRSGRRRWRGPALFDYNVFMVMPFISDEQLDLFCRRWAIAELSLFGSVLREDFGPTSDVDILVTFLPEAQWSLLDHVQMEMELAELLGREVDLITRRAVESSRNPLRRREILETAQTVYTQ